MKRRKVYLLLIIFTVAFSTEAWAIFTKTCKVKYRRGDGSYSQLYSLDVTFLTGRELTQATKDWFSYSMFNNYAVIWFGVGKHSKEPMCAILKIEQLCLPGNEFTESDLPIMGHVTGYDKEGAYWDICTGFLCF